jgi:cell division protein ZipA
MDILVVLGVLVAVSLILIGLYMVLQPKSAARQATPQVDESSPNAASQIETLTEITSEPEQIVPAISANDFITQTIHQHTQQHGHQQTRIHPTLDEEHVVDHDHVERGEHNDLATYDLRSKSTPERELPLLVDSESMLSMIPSKGDEEQDHHGLDAMLDDLAQAISLEEISQHGDIISDLNQVYDSLMPPTTLDVSENVKTQVIDTRQLLEWEGESSLINEHLAEHTRSEEDSILVQAEQIIAIHLLPKSGRPLEGRTVLRILRKYGLRFGEMDLFHRFEETTGEGAMMFSVLKFTQEGPAGFDLDTMEQENFEGLSFFLALPGIKPLQGFDMMMSTAQRLAQECYAQLMDDEMNLLSEQLKGHYRHQVLDFRPSR